MNREKLVEMGLNEEQIEKILAESKKTGKYENLRYRPGTQKEIRQVLFEKNRTVRGILDWLEDRDPETLDEDGFWHGSIEEVGTHVVDEGYIKTTQDGAKVVTYYISKKDLTDCGVIPE